MPRIYQRDNLGSQLTPALEAALNRRRSYEQAEQQRIQSNTNAIVNGLKTVYDAWDKRDMLERQQDFQREQQDFTAGENSKNRQLQRDLQAENIKIQKQQLADNHLVDQAKALRDVKDSYALYKKAMTEQNVSATDRALAKNKLELDLTMARKFGMTHQDLRPYWTQEMIADEAKVNPPTPVPTPEETAGTAPTATPAPAEEQPQIADWPVFYNQSMTDLKAAKTRGDLKGYEDTIDKYQIDRSNASEYAQLNQLYNDKVAGFEKAEKNQREHNGRVATLRSMFEGGNAVSPSAVRNALEMNKRGGGKTEGTFTIDVVRGGRTIPLTLTIKRNGSQAGFYYKGTKVGTVGL